MNVVFMGAPSTGKGTYAKMLKQDYGLPHISTGDLFREEVKNATEIGIQIKDIMEKGMLVPDEITIQVLKKRISQPDCKDGFILDGFPRNLEQAKHLDKSIKIDAVINFVADYEVILHRISGRRICKDCGHIHHIINIPPNEGNKCIRCGGEVYQREDEKPHIVKDRLKIHEEKTKPVIEYYKQKGLLYEIDANLDVNHPEFRVIKDTKKVLDEIKHNKTHNKQGDK